MKITWFRHSHENRNDLLRFGLMRLHYAGQLQYRERPFEQIGRFGFTTSVSGLKDPRHISFLLFQMGTRSVRVLVDSEDSFALITPLIAEVDVCFCSGYNSDFFEKHQFVNAYPWQRDADIAQYQQLLGSKIKDLGQHFSKIKKFVPITTNMDFQMPVTKVQRKLRNLEHRFNRLTNRPDSFREDYKGFEIREQQLEQLRHNSINYDISLTDSLWGWPSHRINLHTSLKSIWDKGYKIHSKLAWLEPPSGNDPTYKGIDPSLFPMETGSLQEVYEVMLSKSRLAVFACGYHWGWRSVMMLALGIGIPVLTDRLLTEAYFDMTEFCLMQQEDHYWKGLEAQLVSISNTEWRKIKKTNQAVYDKYMAPEAVANYFINALN